MSDLYPEPPHLSAFVAPGMKQGPALRAACEVLAAFDCVFSGRILVPRHAEEWFAAVSDVDRYVITSEGGYRSALVKTSPLRLQFRHRRWGTVSLGLSPALVRNAQHPVEVAVNAGAFELPAEFWDREERRSAKKLMGWMERLLLDLAVSTEALYGAIGIEAAFLTPEDLRSTQAREKVGTPTTWFWPQGATAQTRKAEAQLLAALDPTLVARTDLGTLYRAWRAGVDPEVNSADVDSILRFLERSTRHRRAHPEH